MDLLWFKHYCLSFWYHQMGEENHSSLSVLVNKGTVQPLRLRGASIWMQTLILKLLNQKKILIWKYPIFFFTRTKIVTDFLVSKMWLFGDSTVFKNKKKYFPLSRLRLNCYVKTLCLQHYENCLNLIKGTGMSRSWQTLFRSTVNSSKNKYDWKFAQMNIRVRELQMPEWKGRITHFRKIQFLFFTGF